eukprot:CAMPEP_0194244274 /NCGR_PEP_ID=MMETSP0158-20130606/10744_1 /TAXON_ID=33649 /ORGANISM="Thalassionema nitzschioides, Strain L26-B" /LENGTH=244 /DNA_ID=CAMNT_0038979707 /DNA_START=15 /DNA_END=745 /DNA_ORIENTATION=+
MTKFVGISTLFLVYSIHSAVAARSVMRGFLDRQRNLERGSSDSFYSAGIIESREGGGKGKGSKKGSQKTKTRSPTMPPGAEPVLPPESCDCAKEDRIKCTSLTLEYNSKGQNSIYQGSNKASCRAGSYPSPTTVSVNGQSFSVKDGTVFTVDGISGAITEFEIGGQSCTVHTSCSVPIVEYDQIGPFIVTGANGDEESRGYNYCCETFCPIPSPFPSSFPSFGSSFNPSPMPSPSPSADPSPSP